MWLHLKGYESMNRLILFALPFAVAACAGGPPRPEDFQPKLANPSAVIAAEIAFNRLAQDKGQWSAFRETAAKDAMMFVPQPVIAQEWLKGKDNPAQSVKWQPHKAFMSCDGKTGVTTGAWQRANGTGGYFTTVWQFIQKNERGDGTWKWVMDHGDELTIPREPKEMIETKVASCKGRAPASLVAPAEGAKMKAGFSRDQSLNYTWVVQPDGARTVEVKLWNGETSETVLLDRVAAQ
jgi:hypothetical protein